MSDGVFTGYEYHKIDEVTKDNSIKKAIIIGKVVKINPIDLVIYVDDGTGIMPIEVAVPKLPNKGSTVRVFAKILRDNSLTGYSDVIQQIPDSIVNEVLAIEKDVKDEIKKRVDITKER